MIDVKISEKLSKQINKIKNKMHISDGELSGPIFGHFELINKRKILILDKFFDRTTYSSGAYTEFSFNTDFKIKKEVKKGNKWVGTLHTHPNSIVCPSVTDLKMASKIQKQLCIQATAFIIVGKKDVYTWMETNETNKFKNKK